jgi:putative FmdB family regulatory protein
MPIYEYECANCRYYLEVMQKIADAPLKKCPSCGRSTLKKLISAPAFRLKGSGWYETDFKSDQERKRNLVAAEKEDSKSEAKADAKAESKAEAPANGEGKTADAAPAPKASAQGSAAGSAASPAADSAKRPARSQAKKSARTRPVKQAARRKRR